MRLRDKRAVVTGGGSGIGKAVAERFAEEGAHVLIVGRRRDRLEETASRSPRIHAFQADLASENGPAEVAGEAERSLGGIDILVNNAGVFLPAELDSEDTSAFDKQFDLNVRALYRITQAALPALRKGNGASIVNLGSILASAGLAGVCAYSATKGAVAQMTRSLAVELAPEKIRCNTVSPGLVRTDMTEDLTGDPDRAREILSTYPLGRFGETLDVANACVFLASDEASWITGVDLPVDGGYLAR